MLHSFLIKTDIPHTPLCFRGRLPNVPRSWSPCVKHAQSHCTADCTQLPQSIKWTPRLAGHGCLAGPKENERTRKLIPHVGHNFKVIPQRLFEIRGTLYKEPIPWHEFAHVHCPSSFTRTLLPCNARGNIDPRESWVTCLKITWSLFTIHGITHGTLQTLSSSILSCYK